MNAQVAHADADIGVGGSTAATTEVSKSNGDKAETVATSIEPQAPSDEGTSDTNIGKSTTPATSDKAKSDEAAGDQTKTDDQSKKNDPAYDKEEPTVDTIEGVGQEIVVGEDLYLNTDSLTSDQWQKLGVTQSDLPNATLVWGKKPDVSKVSIH